jgi:hypothetical protein
MSTSQEFVNLSEGKTAENVAGRGFPGNYKVMAEIPLAERSSSRAARRLESRAAVLCHWH